MTRMMRVNGTIHNRCFRILFMEGRDCTATSASLGLCVFMPRFAFGDAFFDRESGGPIPPDVRPTSFRSTSGTSRFLLPQCDVQSVPLIPRTLYQTHR